MSKGLDLLKSVTMQSRMQSDNQSAIVTLEEAAKEFENEHNYFSAGYTYSQIIQSLMGHPVNLSRYFAAAEKNYGHCLSEPSSNPISKIATLSKRLQLLTEFSWIFDLTVKQKLDLKRDRAKLHGEMEILIASTYTGDSSEGKYFVHGFQANTNLDGKWWVTLTGWEVDPNSEQYGLSSATLNIPSIFYLKILSGDYQGANIVGDRFPELFNSCGLSGWRMAAKGFCNPIDADTYFGLASEVFAKDRTPPEDLANHGGSWSSKNYELWSSYFASRAELAKAQKFPNMTKEHILTASSLIGEDMLHWIDDGVSRYRTLVNAFAVLLSDDKTNTLFRVRELFNKEARISGPLPYDNFIVDFLVNSDEAVKDFMDNPSKAITEGKMAKALEALDKVPIIDTTLIAAIRPPIGEASMRAMLGGQVNTWMQRGLESITDEKKLHRILLRLLQSSLPLYAQVVHGPLEYGTDVAALLRNDEKLQYRQYQLKCGGMNKAQWALVQNQLEQIFLMDPTPSFHPEAKTAERVAYLVHNGHANTITSPLMDRWFEVQKKIYGRHYEYMHLDKLINWIIDSKLTNELKIALQEEGVIINP